MPMPLLVGGPLSGQEREMPDDKMVASVPLEGGKFSPYARTRVTFEGEVEEIWGWAPLCYRKVKMLYVHLQEQG
jgi:hypothetical protein